MSRIIDLDVDIGADAVDYKYDPQSVTLGYTSHSQISVQSQIRNLSLPSR
jgi:hypothetical protein